MSERCQGSVRCSCEDLREALSIHTRKITDSCRDKDCIEDLRVYLTKASQNILDGCSGAKVRCGELLYTYIDVEPVAFDRNHYCVDATFYYRILADGTVGNCRPVTLHGVAVFSKRAVLCGEDSRAHIYTSDTRIGQADGLTAYAANRPTAVVEILDPMVLSSKVKEVCDCSCDNALVQIPGCVKELFDEEMVVSGEKRRLFVTLGQFSVIRLERDAQLVVPVVDCAVPSRECCDAGGSTEDPCEMFSKIPFPTAQFCPTGCSDPCPSANDGCGYKTLGN
jgi:hypothetical protein